MIKFISTLAVVLVISLQIAGQCGGYFKEQSRQMLPTAFNYAHFEDMDGDGLKDLVGYSVTSMALNGISGFQIIYYKRLGVNSFDTTAKITSVTNVFNAFIGLTGDVNGDGFKDLLVRHSDGREVRVYINDGTGRFTSAESSLTTANNEEARALSDLNGDGKADLISATTGIIYYRLAQPNNSFGAAVAIGKTFGSLESGRWVRGARDGFGNNRAIIAYTVPMLVEDLNNDSLKDIAFVGLFGQGYVVGVLTNNGNLTFTSSPGVGFGPVVTKLRAYDFNGDGKKDLVSDYNNNTGARYARNNGNNTFTSSALPLPLSSGNTYSDTYSTKNYSAGDFDGDGDIDLIYPGDKFYALLKNDGSGAFTAQQIKYLPSIEENVNLDGDGKDDAVFLNYPFLNGIRGVSDASNTHYFYEHNGVSFRKNVCQSQGDTKIIDFNGDSTVDRAFWNPSTGYWRYYNLDGALQTDQTYYQFGSGSLNDVPAPNDYDGDGKTDYAIYRKSNGTWWIAASSGQNNFGFSFGTAEDKPVPADYDGDGKADIAVYRPSNGTWHLWLSASQQYLAVQFGIAEDKPVTTDYDGDGKADIAVFRPSTGAWYVLKSSDGLAFALQYGISTDIPVPGDYDGDGKANITVFRNGVWYVLKSDYSTAGIYFGTTGDVPFFNYSMTAPSVGVYRPSDSKYYLTYAGPLGSSAQPTGNSTGETFVSSILPTQ